MVLVELWIVQNSNLFGSVLIHLVIIPVHLNWAIFLLFSPLRLVWEVSFMLHHSYWLVWLIGWFEFTDLPQLQSVKLSNSAFFRVHSVVFESDWMNWLMIQICQNYTPFNLVIVLLKVMMVIIVVETTHWQCEVRLNEMIYEKTFLYWLASSVVHLSSIRLVLWFLRVLLWSLIDVDIPQLSSSGIKLDEYMGFYNTYSLQSSSTHSLISSSFDASALASVIRRKSCEL